MKDFIITEHQVPGQYGREYPNGLLDESRPPWLSVKQYRPRRNSRPGTRGATFILAGGIGFIKEAYEALIEDVDAQLASRNVRVANYWIADMYCIGGSAVLNQGNLGNSPSWYDHSRDLMSVINHFRTEMQQPLFGMGHSMGAAQIAHLSLLHPRLFHSIILIEPAMYPGLERRAAFTQGKGMVRRRELIHEPEKAKSGIEKSPFYQTWDARARSALLKHGYVDAQTSQPVDLDAELPKTAIRTSTPKDSEVSLLFRPNLGHIGKDGSFGEASIYDRLTVPDVNPASRWIYPFYRAESVGVYERIDHIRASVFYVVGDQSASSTPELRKHRLEQTGTGVGGSGGHQHGRVEEMVVSGGGHQIAMDESLPQVVEGISGWVAKETEVWRDLKLLVQNQGEARGKPNTTMVESLREWTPAGSSIENIVKSKM